MKRIMLLMSDQGAANVKVEMGYNNYLLTDIEL